MITKEKILLLGNGLLQAHGGESWNDFLKSITMRDDLDQEPRYIQCPEPLKAILVTGDAVDVAMRNKCQAILNGETINGKLASILQNVLRMGFDHILTTNYTYELEQAAIYPKRLTEYKLKSISTSTTGRVEPKYLMHTYNAVNYGGTNNNVWHIHGEARKPDSTILGHYYYGNSLFRIKQIAGDVKPWKKEKSNKQSWVEAFLFGDIYCLGFGFGVSEFDLWWLLNRKAREKYNTGKLYFYEPKDDQEWAKIDLLKLMKCTSGDNLVEILDMGMTKSNDMDWEGFYSLALTDIQKRIEANDISRMK